MSFWRKLFGGSAEGRREPSEPPPAPVHEPDEAVGALPPSPEEQLRRLGEERDAAPEQDEVLGLLDQVRASGREARAVDLARRVLARHPDLPAVSLRLAEVLSARGDDVGAEALLVPLCDRPGVPPRALLLRGEIAERRGDETEALSWYERVLARQLDFPGARERVQRLREEREPERNLAGATLLTDGALARGRYRVTRELGRGGAGTVFAATDTALGRQVALKVYHRRGRFERERLRIESRTPAQLEHPGVIRVFDVDEALSAIAMEWVRGGSVRQELRKGRLEESRMRRWLGTALDALDYIHRHGVVHRDLKPSNFLLRADERVVLTDFGIAARVGETPGERLGGGEGTLAYMAPEQRAGAPADAAADVHAFGATMREMLGQVLGEVDGGLVELAEACMRREPDARPSVAELRRALPETGPWLGEDRA